MYKLLLLSRLQGKRLQLARLQFQPWTPAARACAIGASGFYFSPNFAKAPLFVIFSLSLFGRKFVFFLLHRSDDCISAVIVCVSKFGELNPYTHTHIYL